MDHQLRIKMDIVTGKMRIMGSGRWGRDGSAGTTDSCSLTGETAMGIVRARETERDGRGHEEV